MFLYVGTIFKVWENGIISETQWAIHLVVHGFKAEKQFYNWPNGLALNLH